MNPSEPVFFHVDMDAFYASVEQADNPELCGKPVIIGASPGQRGVVSACSYEARQFGIHSAMPISQAFNLCPDGVFLPVRMERYQDVSQCIMQSFQNFTPEVQQISVDEATLNMTGTERLFGYPEQIAMKIKTRIREEFNLAISIGIAPNRYLAKLASEIDKPDGLYRIRSGDETAFMRLLELKDIWGLGKKTLERLYELNITSVARLQELPESALVMALGKGAGGYLYTVSHGRNPGIYNPAPSSKSISSERTFGTDTRDATAVRRVLLQLAHEVMFRLMKEGYKSRTVTFKIRFSDFTTHTSRKTLLHPVGSAEEIYETVLEMLEKRWKHHSPLRLIGLGLANLEKTGDPAQQQLFEETYDRQKKVEMAVLGIKSRGSSIMKASLLKGKKKDRDQSR